MIRSKRLLERRSRKRKVPKKPDHIVPKVSSAMIVELKKKIEKGLNTNDPFRLFLWGSETKQLLTVKEEKDMFLHIQAYFLPMLHLQVFFFGLLLSLEAFFWGTLLIMYYCLTGAYEIGGS